jgi:glyoxylase-like metal-dependent hydrolase (beta-lactamase superfamily II)
MPATCTAIPSSLGMIGPTLGKLLKNLEVSAYRPDQVDEIYLTHLRPDHIGGLIADGKMAFPNATVRAARQEADFWLNEERMHAAPKEQQSAFELLYS